MSTSGTGKFILNMHGKKNQPIFGKSRVGLHVSLGTLTT